MLPALQAWESSPPPDAPQLVVIASGPEHDVREIGLKSPILYDPYLRAAAVLGTGGTPTAAVIDADGTYRSRLAGAQEILPALGAEDELVPAGAAEE
jgi:hypothetical protein